MKALIKRASLSILLIVFAPFARSVACRRRTGLHRYLA